MATTLVPHSQDEVIRWARIDLYRFFTFALGAPSRERHEWFSQSGTAAALRDLWRQLSKKKFPGFRWFNDYASYEAAYIAVFDVGAPEAPVPLFESAHIKTRQAQELVLENTFFYDVFGLRVDPARSAPDHLLTQLEFLSAVAYARECSRGEPRSLDLDRLEFDFLSRHVIEWTREAERKLGRCPFPVFRVLFSMMVNHIRQRVKFMHPIFGTQ